jgi:RHS repeat-associated protein
VTRVTQPGSFQTNYAYDLNGRLSSVTNPLSYTTKYRYDQVGRMIEVENGRGYKTKYFYDAAGRKTKETDAEGFSTTFTYDAASNLYQKTDAKSQTITYAYDNMNRLTSKTYPNSSSASYSYDDIGRMTGASWDNHGYTLSYNDGNFLTGLHDHDADKAGATDFTYAYDNRGNKTQMAWSYNNGSAANTTNYTYDKADRQTALSTAGGDLQFGYSYDPRGMVTRLDYPAATGKYLTYGYNNAGWLTGIGGNAIAIDYEYNSRGLITKMSAPQNNGEHYDYTYDDAAQLTAASYQNSGHTNLQTYSWSYDGNGNRGPGTFSPTDKAEYAGGNSCTFDANGNMISENGNTRTYDYENRLTGGTGIATKKYTALSKERGYAYDGLRELVNLGASLPSYVRGARGELLAELSSANSVNYYAYTDHIGSVMAKGNSSGTVTDYAKYDPFGKVLTALPNVPFGFAGARIDSQTNYYSMGARYYNPAQGRFVTRDTWASRVWHPWTWNLYSYCRNSPLNYVDPSGHGSYSTQDSPTYWLPDEEIPALEPSFSNVIEFAFFVASVYDGLVFLEAASIYLTTESLAPEAAEVAQVAAEAPEAKGAAHPGRLGGPEHKATVAKEQTKYEAQGYTVTKEAYVRTPEGSKSGRFADLQATKQNESGGLEVRYVQVGRETQGGLPVSRERTAIRDIETASGSPVDWIPYNSRKND